MARLGGNNNSNNHWTQPRSVQSYLWTANLYYCSVPKKVASEENFYMTLNHFIIKTYLNDESEHPGSFGDTKVWKGSRSVVHATIGSALTYTCFSFYLFIIISLLVHTYPQLTQLSPSNPLQRGNYKLQTDLETSAALQLDTRVIHGVIFGCRATSPW